MKPHPRREGIMRWLARAALAALGSVATLFIACAYGVPWRYSKSGHVLDSISKQGIPAIQVACVDEQGRVLRDVRTAADGAFTLGVDACDALAVSDVDGAVNGTYAPSIVPFTPQDESGMVVELDAVP